MFLDGNKVKNNQCVIYHIKENKKAFPQKCEKAF